MPLMGSLYIGSSGLQTSQNALNTTAHNLSNSGTTGYVRQQVQLGTKSYTTLSVNPNAVVNQQYGLGVNYTNVKQVRDYFLDLTYRKESGRNSFYEVSANALGEIETLLGEMNQEPFQESLEGVWESIQELAKDPSSTVTQGLFIQNATIFLERAIGVYDGLVSYQDNLNKEVKTQVDTMNNYAKTISYLNLQIQKIEAGGVESANDLRDARNQLIDELAAYGNITVSEDIYGNTNIQLEGVDFVRGEVVYEIGLKEDLATGFYTAYWTQNAKATTDANGNKVYDIEGAEVFDLSRLISTDLNTDIGALRATLLARGDHRATYQDLTNSNYDNTVSQSIIMNIQAEFDQLIHNIATTINDILASASDPTTGYLCNADGTPIRVFDKITESEEYTTSNLVINQELQKNPYLLGFIKPDGEADYETIEKLKEAFTAETNTLNPNVQKKTNFLDYYSDLVSQVANSGYVYNSILTNQQLTLESTFSAREQIIGVSTDDELTNMIKYQNAYNAASRYINVISEMLEHIVTSL